MTFYKSLSPADAEAAVLGGAVLGGGGGGSMETGLNVAGIAVRLGDIALKPIDEMPDDDVLLTVSAVGAPAAVHRYVKPMHYIRAVELFSRFHGCQVNGLITNECGGSASVNGWLQSAVLGLPLIDAPCNGRAHPTGIMGSMGLHKVPGYISRQVAVGGNPFEGRYLEIGVSGGLEATAGQIRNASVQAGGLVAVARNPVTVKYARENAALGAISQCISVGKAMLAAKDKGADYVIRSAAEVLQGQIIIQGTVAELKLETTGGFDVGRLLVRGKSGLAELTFWNEYMTVEIDGTRLATFPALLTTLDASTGLPVSTAEICEGRQVAVLHVDSRYLSLGGGMKDPALFLAVEKAIAKPVVNYIF